MNYIIAASTDIGIKKKTNQDSLSVRTISYKNKNVVFAILCDGMGGLSKGEVASSSVVYAFKKWTAERLSPMLEKGINEKELLEEWNSLVITMNEKLMSYGNDLGVSLGTTLAAILLTDDRYYAINVGDSRIYEITDDYIQITEDQTVISREIKMGLLTPEQAKTDPRRNMLLQCIGASNKVIPDTFTGKTKKDAIYMLCSDGFRHEITSDEIYQTLHPNVMLDENSMKENMDSLIELNKQRMETDNISVITIRTY